MLDFPMAKKASGRTGRPPSGQDNVAVKMDRAAVRLAKHVAEYEGVTVPELLTSIVRPVLDHKMKVIAAEMLKALEPRK